ncbi:helix-turn-helix domain-containing protein [Nocardia brevicatena]|uniref:PucR family transcriptional regulator n=1 Tax=Nocardia brevicatena TaxID=37327 RepID=UPI0002DD8CFD|nr:helix-turn-helix domain-containing protein [Nocardia brevicatena]
MFSLEEHYPQALLVRSPDLADRLVGRTLGPVLRRPARERAALLEALTAWLEENRSAAGAALRLHCHRNTVLNRLHRIEELTGHPLNGHTAFVEISPALSAISRTGDRIRNQSRFGAAPIWTVRPFPRREFWAPTHIPPCFRRPDSTVPGPTTSAPGTPVSVQEEQNRA